MTTDDADNTVRRKRIMITKNGPYVVEGDIPLVRKTQVVSEHGEPLTWRKDGEIPVSREGYRLCRCGKSGNLPFCDDTHEKVEFDGTEVADITGAGTRKSKMERSTGIIVEKDASLCMLSGYCEFSDVGLARMVASTQDTKMRALVMAMVERCPAGALTYRIEADGPDIEPDLPQQIALTTEITSFGPISGPLWVTGNIPVVQSDDQAYPTRNRVTLCNCGHSYNKPFCDGRHRDIAQEEEWRRRRAEG
ncbi:hypothetical protein ANAEL_04671 [Anaerolineales bacterium]|nr:hypothetical protein ANAEL_04671 [Anaerolineales bacterium]